MTSSPPVLPISVDQTTPAVGAAPIATPAARLFLSRLLDSIRRSLSDRRPWSELVDRSAFSRPESTSEAVARVRKNVSYFRVNYVAVVGAVLAVSLLTNPFSLILLLGLLAAWCFLYLLRPADAPVVILGRQFSDRETFVGLILVSAFVIFLTSVGSIIISAVLTGTAAVCAHGAFRVPEDLFLDEQDSGTASGFLSFLGGATASAAAAGAQVAGRV